MVNLPDNVRDDVLAVLAEHLSGVEVRLVGSRTQQAVKPFADIDLLVMCEAPLSASARAMLNTAFEESPIPYKVDVLESASLSADFLARLLTDSEVLASV